MRLPWFFFCFFWDASCLPAETLLLSIAMLFAYDPDYNCKRYREIASHGGVPSRPSAAGLNI
jgi:hypothetical protein